MRNSLYRIAPSSCGCSTCATTQVVTVVTNDGNGNTPPPGPTLQMLKFVISADGTGQTDSSFDGYKPAGNTLTDTRLVGSRIALIQVAGVTIYDFGTDATSLTNGTIDFTAMGGLAVDAKVVIVYLPPNTTT